MSDRHSQVAGLSIAPETSRKNDLWPKKYFRDPIRGSPHVFSIRIRSRSGDPLLQRVFLAPIAPFLHNYLSKI